MIDPLLAEKSSDEELIALTLKDQDYFGEIIKRYQVKLFNYIVRISGLAAEDAEDVALRSRREAGADESER